MEFYVSHNRSSDLSGESGKDTLDVSREKSEENLREKHATLSTGVNSWNWVKRGGLKKFLKNTVFHTRQKSREPNLLEIIRFPIPSINQDWHTLGPVYNYYEQTKTGACWYQNSQAGTKYKEND